MWVLDIRDYSGIENLYVCPFTKYWKRVLSQSSKGGCRGVLLPCSWPKRSEGGGQNLIGSNLSYSTVSFEPDPHQQE